MRLTPTAVLLFVCAAILTVKTPFLWIIALTDGAYVAALLASAAGYGVWLLLALERGGAWPGPLPFPETPTCPVMQRGLLAVALGLAALATLALALGVMGALGQVSAQMMIGAGMVLGVTRVWLSGRSPAPTTLSAPVHAPRAVTDYLCAIALAAMLAALLYAASFPPAILWRSEAFGYDVLEYHLQAPREYYESGRVSFLPHNVYASFPQQMEMLFLVLMWLMGGPYEAAIAAQWLHAGLGVLFVLALVAWRPQGAPPWRVALLGGLNAWLVIVGALAYVECGLLFFGALAAGQVMAALESDARDATKRLWAAGLLAGIAGGCKYTALALIGVGLALAWLIAARLPLGRRCIGVAALAIGGGVAFSPWLIRNAAFTGNPIYPMAYAVFGGAAWSPAQAEQWARGHQPPVADRGVGSRLGIAARELFGEVRSAAPFGADGSTERMSRYQPSYYNPGLIGAALLGVFVARRDAAVLLTWMAAMLATWVWLTQIPGRFAVPLIIPLTLLAGAAQAQPTPGVRRAATVLSLFGAVFSLFVVWEELSGHERFWEARTGVAPARLIGATDAFADHALNGLPAGANVKLIGDAAVFYLTAVRFSYSVVFSRDPWVELAEQGAGPEALIAWLRERQITHVAFSWGEIERLRRTYGFSATLTLDWAARLESAGMERCELRQGAPRGLMVLSVPGDG